MTYKLMKNSGSGCSKQIRIWRLPDTTGDPDPNTDPAINGQSSGSGSISSTKSVTGFATLLTIQGKLSMKGNSDFSSTVLIFLVKKNVKLLWLPMLISCSVSARQNFCFRKRWNFRNEKRIEKSETSLIYRKKHDLGQQRQLPFYPIFYAEG